MTDTLTRRLDGPITIRRAETVVDYRACQEAQRLAWGISEPGYVVPIATMVGANLHGGLVLGAFLDDGRAVGLSFGFLGRVEDRLCLYSQLTGVIPQWQAHGIGHEMKMAQREFARESSIPLIAWAFDPLQAGNASFNLNRLGAKVRRYVDNMYGERTDALNAGIPTDRVIAEWEIAERVSGPKESPASWHEFPRLIQTSETRAGDFIPTKVDDSPKASKALVEIPERISDLRRQRPEAAESWRIAVRQALTAAFALGFRAVGFLREASDVAPRCGYVLRRQGNGAEPGRGPV